MLFELESPTELEKPIIALLFVNKSISSFSVSFHVVAMFRVSPFWVKTAAISSVKLTNLALGEPGTHDKQHIRQGYCTLCTRTSQVNVEWNCRFRTHHHLGHPAGDPRCLCSFGWKSQSSRILRIIALWKSAQEWRFVEPKTWYIFVLWCFGSTFWWSFVYLEQDVGFSELKLCYKHYSICSHCLPRSWQ